MMVPSTAAGLEAGTQTLEAGITHADWNLMTKEIVKKTVEMTLAEALAPVQAVIDLSSTLSLLLLLFCFFLFPDCSHHCCCICS
jgi:hypothetical protein